MMIDVLSLGHRQAYLKATVDVVVTQLAEASGKNGPTMRWRREGEEY